MFTIWKTSSVLSDDWWLLLSQFRANNQGLIQKEKIDINFAKEAQISIVAKEVVTQR